MSAKESYTIIAQDLRDPILMRLETFIDRDKMKEFLLEYARQHRRCIIIPGLVDDIDYQVEYENDEIKELHFEDEPGYKPPFIIMNYKDIINLGDKNE